MSPHYNEPLALTEYLLRMPRPFTSGLVMNRPGGRRHTIHSRLLQVRMWRDYAMTWHGKRSQSGVDQEWCEKIGGWTYEECKRRARVNLYLARRLARHPT